MSLLEYSDKCPGQEAEQTLSNGADGLITVSCVQSDIDKNSQMYCPEHIATPKTTRRQAQLLLFLPAHRMPCCNP
jgi:hypothetical protein